MKLGDQIMINIKTLPDENSKMNFDNKLKKKFANVEILGSMLLQQERDYLITSKQ